MPLYSSLRFGCHGQIEQVSLVSNFATRLRSEIFRRTAKAKQADNGRISGLYAFKITLPGRAG